MYNEKILNQLDNLKYLGALKGSNISVVSKPNEFSDTVKFYAQINTDDVIQKITYRASGCTHFLVFCNYFCSLVEGKTVKSALNVKSEKLESFVELDESKLHIIPIILDAFALLIKRYRKGVERGKIEPSLVLEKTQETPKTRPMTSKAFTKVVGEIIKNMELSHKHNDEIAVSKNNSEVKANKQQKTEKIETIKVDEPKNETIKDKVENKNSQKTKTSKTMPKAVEEIDKDMPLESLADEGVVLDTLVVDTQKEIEDNKKVIAENKTDKKPKTTRSKKKVEQIPVIEETNNETIEGLNKEITGLIDTIEQDIASEIKVEEVVEDKKEVEIIPVEKKSTTKKSAKTLTTKKDKEDKTKDKPVEKVKKQEVKTEVKEETAVKPIVEDKKQSNSFLALKSMLSSRTTIKPVVEEKKVEDKKTENKLNNLSAMLNKMNHNTTSKVDEKKEDKKSSKVALPKKEVAKKEEKKLETKKELNNTKNNSADKLSSLKASLANIKTNNHSNNDNITKQKSAKIEKSNKIDKTSEKNDKKSVNKETIKKEKTSKTSNVKVEKKEKLPKNEVKKIEKQPKEIKEKKPKKNDYDMEYEPINDTAKKGFFSWLRRK